MNVVSFCYTPPLPMLSMLFCLHTVARYLVLCNVEVFGSNNRTKGETWPHPSLLTLEHSKPGQSCTEACLAKQMVCNYVVTGCMK